MMPDQLVGQGSSVTRFHIYVYRRGQATQDLFSVYAFSSFSFKRTANRITTNRSTKLQPAPTPFAPFSSTTSHPYPVYRRFCLVQNINSHLSSSSLNIDINIALAPFLISTSSSQVRKPIASKPRSNSRNRSDQATEFKLSTYLPPLLNLHRTHHTDHYHHIPSQKTIYAYYRSSGSEPDLNTLD